MMNASTRWIGAWVLLFCVSGAWAAGAVPPIKQFIGTCSTGQQVAGPVLKSDANSVTVRNGRKSQKIYTINLLEWSMELSDEQKEAIKDKSDTERAIVIGESLLKKKWRSLAELQFRKAFAADPGCKNAILQAYKSCRTKLPTKSLFKPIPRLYSRQRIKDVKFNTETHRGLGRKMRIASANTHVIETEHFVIYSDWSKKDNARLAGIYEKLYRELCKQFAISPEENIWIGKLPVFAFWKKTPYVQFSRSTGFMMAEKAAGYAGRRGSLSYVVLGPVNSKNKAEAISWFYQLLCHETAHAFIGRYISDLWLVSWLNEGIAETMSSKLVPNGRATKAKLTEAHKKVKKGWLPVVGNLFGPRRIPVESLYYGCVQSMTRFLIAKDRKKFVQMVTLIKNGADPEKAMKEAYGFANYAVFLKQWKKNVQKTVR